MDFDLERGIAVLRRTPGVLRALPAGLGEAVGPWEAYLPVLDR